MKTQFYSGKGIQRPKGASDLPVPQGKDFVKPEKYLANDGLVDAANVALMLGQPLLLTGEAGTGKTQFAYSLAWELGLDDPLKFETKSTSAARDLFYTYDALKRFQHVQTKVESDSILPYITYQALGLAILRTRTADLNKDLVSDDFEQPNKPLRSVVLIDEIDKAPRDFPNDILNEIEDMYFRIPEMGNKEVKADRTYAKLSG
jgi:MoxR-like ATPase